MNTYSIGSWAVAPLVSAQLSILFENSKYYVFEELALFNTGFKLSL